MNIKLTEIAAVILSNICLLVFTTASAQENDILSIKVSPVEGEEFRFGEMQKAIFYFENISDRMILLESIQPLCGYAQKVQISGAVYGSIGRNKATDSFIYNPLTQCLTDYSFHGGLVLPGDSMSVHALFRAVTQTEEFIIYCLVSENTYNDIRNASEASNVYIFDIDKKEDAIFAYIPFTEPSWKRVANANSVIEPWQHSMHLRSAIIPNLHQNATNKHVQTEEDNSGVKFEQKEIFLKQRIPVANEFFSSHEAKATASTISKVPEEDLLLAYSHCWRKYIVFENDSCWFLSSRNQVKKGELLGIFPPVLLNEIDSRGRTKIRTGDKQEGFGPNVKKSTRVFWNSYPVYFGDGMYTSGEFLHLNADELLGFLRLAKDKGFRIRTGPIVIHSHRYYELEKVSE